MTDTELDEDGNCVACGEYPCDCEGFIRRDNQLHLDLVMDTLSRNLRVMAMMAYADRLDAVPEHIKVLIAHMPIHRPKLEF